jgi:hypothetical protein
MLLTLAKEEINQSSKQATILKFAESATELRGRPAGKYAKGAVGLSGSKLLHLAELNVRLNSQPHFPFVDQVEPSTMPASARRRLGMATESGQAIHTWQYTPSPWGVGGLHSSAITLCGDSCL